MSDDTATVERVLADLRDGASYDSTFKYYDYRDAPDGEDEQGNQKWNPGLCSQAVALIEQQARTIAELTKADEVHWKTRRSLLAKISELRLELLGAERAQEWTREDRIASEKTIAEQAARLAECERALDQAFRREAAIDGAKT